MDICKLRLADYPLRIFRDEIFSRATWRRELAPASEKKSGRRKDKITRTGFDWFHVKVVLHGLDGLTPAHVPSASVGRKSRRNFWQRLLVGLNPEVPYPWAKTPQNGETVGSPNPPLPGLLLAGTDSCSSAGSSP